MVCGLWGTGQVSGIQHKASREEIKLEVYTFVYLYTSAGWDEYLTLALALIGKCSIGNSFCVIYLFSAELFPTEVRYIIIYIYYIGEHFVSWDSENLSFAGVWEWEWSV